MNGDIESQVNKSRNFEGTAFKVAPKVDQTKVYDTVFEKLSLGGAVGIFPEGGSHDRTELLPLKGAYAYKRVEAHRLMKRSSRCCNYGSRSNGCEP